jgi:Zn-dependent protease with chaperone function
VRRRARDERAIPEHPFRDSAILYGALALVILIVTVATGGSLLPGDTDKSFVLGALDRLGALAVAAAFFVAATSFSWWQWRERIAGKRR